MLRIRDASRCARTSGLSAPLRMVALTVTAGVALSVMPSGPALADAKRANEIIQGLQYGGGSGGSDGNQISDVCNQLLASLDGISRTATEAEIETVDTCTADSPRLSFRVTFRLGSADLDDEAIPVLQELGYALEDGSFADALFMVGGHTDTRGSRKLNVRLSQRRAASVRDYLVENFRVSSRQLRAIGFGFDTLANTSDPYADENRRVEIVRLK